MPRAEEVAKYLQEHPEFFEEYAELLSSIQVPHPHGSHAIPLAERQMLSLRDKSRKLEGKLRELVQFGEENDLISDRVHRLTMALLTARDLQGVLDALYRQLTDDFGVPAVALRLWWEQGSANGAEFEPPSEEARIFAESLANPYFSDTPMFESAMWFAPTPEPLRSFVYVCLRAERSLGVLVLASPDPDRFTRDMGILYLARLGELVSGALRRQLEG